MSQYSFKSSDYATLFGAGPAHHQDIACALKFTNGDIYACDGGAKTALAAGLSPKMVIGDFDSFPADIEHQIPQTARHHITCQNTTDFDKALANIDAKALLCVGFLGGRLDHQLAVFSSIIKDLRPIILIGGGEIVCVCPPRLDLCLPVQTPIAMYPLLKCNVRTQGLQWDCDTPMAPNGVISTSNTVAKPNIYIETNARALLVILPHTALDHLARALT